MLGLKISLSRKPRTCDLCGGGYNRRNLVEGWNVQNPGHRAGWVKTRIRVCTRCGGAPLANRILRAVTLISVKK